MFYPSAKSVLYDKPENSATITLLFPSLHALLSALEVPDAISQFPHFIHAAHFTDGREAAVVAGVSLKGRDFQPPNVVIDYIP